MGVSNGQYANETTFNDAFMARNNDTDTVGKVDLKNVASESGAQITNLQRNINMLCSVLGISPNQAYNLISTIAVQDVQVTGAGLGSRFLGKSFAQASSTGLIWSNPAVPLLKVNAGDNSKFDIAALFGEVVDLTDIQNPDITPVNFSAQTGITVTNLATSDVTYILINDAGGVVQQTTYPTPDERRQNIFLGRLNHSNRTSISFANSFPDFKTSVVSSFYDLCDALAPFKIGGLVVTPNGANLSFNKTSGEVFFRSSNYDTDKLNPHRVSFSSASPQAFRKMTSTVTTDVSDVTVIDPAKYDNAGTATTIAGSGNQATIQRVWLYKSGAVRVQYGPTVYQNLGKALENLTTEIYTPNPTIEGTAVLIAAIVVTANCTDLSDSDKAKVITAARFDIGGSSGSGGGGVEVAVTIDNTLVDGDTLAIDPAAFFQDFQIEGASGMVTLDDYPFGTTPPVDGAEITCIGTSGTKSVTIPSVDDAYGAIFAGELELTEGRIVTFKFILSKQRYYIKSKNF